MSKIPPHIERLMEERDELAEKTGKLLTFIETNPKYKELHPAQQEMMQEQKVVMLEYLRVLDQRLLLAQNN